MADIYDAASRTFWANVEARSGSTPPPPLGTAPARWELPPEVRLYQGPINGLRMGLCTATLA